MIVAPSFRSLSRRLRVSARGFHCWCGAVFVRFTYVRLSLLSQFRPLRLDKVLPVRKKEPMNATINERSFARHSKAIARQTQKRAAMTSISVELDRTPKIFTTKHVKI